MFKEYIIERSKKFSPTELVYHGTSTEYLKSILSKGLLAYPNKSNFKLEPKYFTRTLQSVGGVYLSTNFGKASLMAGVATNESYDKLIIVCQVSRSVAFADEDDIEFLLNSAFGNTINNFNIPAVFGDVYSLGTCIEIFAIIKNGKGLIDDIVRQFIEEIQLEYRKKYGNPKTADIVNNKPKIQFSIAKRIFINYIIRALSRYRETTESGAITRDSYYNFKKYYLYGLQYLFENNIINNDEYEEIKKNIKYPKIDIKTAELNNLKSLDYLSKFFKQTINYGKDEEHKEAKDFRITKDIGYTSRNKIICIFSMNNRGDGSAGGYGTYCSVYYGIIPNDTLLEMITRTGGRIKIRDLSRDKNKYIDIAEYRNLTQG
jgi:hypothetical protein